MPTTTLTYCDHCQRETTHTWHETDDSWRRAGVTDAVSGYWECQECGTEVRV